MGRWADALRDWLNHPLPAELALLIYVPVSSATLRDLYAPMIVGRRNCECKCEARRQHCPAKNSNKKRVSQFSMSHFPCPFRNIYDSKLVVVAVLFPLSEI